MADRKPACQPQHAVRTVVLHGVCGCGGAPGRRGAVDDPTLHTPASADLATLRAEHDRLSKELNDAKRKFVAVAKKKQHEFSAK